MKYIPIITSVNPAAANRIDESGQYLLIGRITMVHPNVLIDFVVRRSAYRAALSTVQIVLVQ